MRVTALKEVTYDPSVFMDIATVDDAVRVILTPEDGMTSAHRWKAEAPYLMDMIGKHIAKGATVLDYGCGIGRLSKPLIDKHGCDVIGVDISPNMRALATSCVDSRRFVAIHPDMVWMFRRGIADLAIAVWTLQHCFKPDVDIDNIHRMLTPWGDLFVVNNVRRVVPVEQGRWADDQIDIDTMICERGFEPVERGQIDDDTIAPAQLRANTFWAVYRKT
jgi:SAM-dependent methyltransferase